MKLNSLFKSCAAAMLLCASTAGNAADVKVGVVLTFSGGAALSPLLRRIGLIEQPNIWVPVTETLQSKLFNSVFVAGDAADLIGQALRRTARLGRTSSNG